MIEIDGSFGEGGGQVLRTSLTMAVMLGEDFHICKIRAGRKKPGLRPQHLKAVEAAGSMCGAVVRGAEIGSQELTFRPGPPQAGKYHVDIGTAGSTSLVLQTVLLPLSKGGKASQISIVGGTHVPWSPCYHYLDWQWRFFLARMGLTVNLEMDRAGFYPQGGGRIRATVQPGQLISALTIKERGKLLHVRGISGVANLARKIGERQRSRVVHRLGSTCLLNDIRIVNLPAKFKGTVLLLLAVFEHSQACFFGLGAPGKPADTVADEAIDALEAFLATDGVIDPYAADQLLVPMAFAQGRSEIRTSEITSHLVTNAEIIQRFLPVKMEIIGAPGKPGWVRVGDGFS